MDSPASRPSISSRGFRSPTSSSCPCRFLARRLTTTQAHPRLPCRRRSAAFPRSETVHSYILCSCERRASQIPPLSPSACRRQLARLIFLRGIPGGHRCGAERCLRQRLTCYCSRRGCRELCEDGIRPVKLSSWLALRRPAGFVDFSSRDLDSTAYRSTPLWRCRGLKRFCCISDGPSGRSHRWVSLWRCRACPLAVVISAPRVVALRFLQVVVAGGSARSLLIHVSHCLFDLRIFPCDGVCTCSLLQRSIDISIRGERSCCCTGDVPRGCKGHGLAKNRIHTLQWLYSGIYTASWRHPRGIVDSCVFEGASVV